MWYIYTQCDIYTMWDRYIYIYIYTHNEKAFKKKDIYIYTHTHNEKGFKKKGICYMEQHGCF